MKSQAVMTIGLAGIFVFSAGVAAAKKKKEKLLPEMVLKAQTVLVVILPNAAEPVSDVTSNRRAQEEVEKALVTWGRYRLALDVKTADLVIGVRRGGDKPFTPTVSGGPVDTRPVTVDQSDGQIRIGGSQGRPTSGVSQTADPGPPGGSPRTGMEAGPAEDVLQVFLGGVEFPADNPPLWSFTGKDGLRGPAVRAIEEFRKAVEETEKAVAAKKQQAQPGAGKKTP